MTTVVIVDDQPLQRFGFRMLLESAPAPKCSARRRTESRPCGRSPNCVRTSC